MASYRRGALAALLVLAGCADPAPPAQPVPSSETFEPAPLPGVRAVRHAQNGPVSDGPVSVRRPLQFGVAPGTGAIPVSSSPVRGTVTTNLLDQSF